MDWLGCLVNGAGAGCSSDTDSSSQKEAIITEAARKLSPAVMLLHSTASLGVVGLATYAPAQATALHLGWLGLKDPL